MASSHFLLPLLALLLLLFSVTIAAPEKHLVTQLPGFHGAFPSKHYSGYITVDESNDRRLFYYLVLSERAPATDPVVLWLNGGPGCSSFDGFVYENGPSILSLEALRESCPSCSSIRIAGQSHADLASTWSIVMLIPMRTHTLGMEIGINFDLSISEETRDML